MIAFHEEVRPADGPGGQAADPGQPELLPPRRPVPRGERREVRQVRDRRVRRPHRLRLPGGGHQPDVVAAEAVGAAATAGRARSRSPNGQYTQVGAARPGAVPHADDRLPLLLPAAGQVRPLPGPRGEERAVRRRRRSRSRSTWWRSRRSSTPTAWDYVSQNGTNEEVLAFLNRENVRALNLDKIAFRMKDRGVLRGGRSQLLQDRHLYHPTLWSYGLLPRRRGRRPAVPAARRTRSSTEAGGPIDQPAADDRPGRPGTSTSTWSTSRW